MVYDPRAPSTKNRPSRERGQYRSFVGGETLILRLQSAADRTRWLTSQLGHIFLPGTENYFEYCLAINCGRPLNSNSAGTPAVTTSTGYCGAFIHCIPSSRYTQHGAALNVHYIRYCADVSCKLRYIESTVAIRSDRIDTFGPSIDKNNINFFF